MRKIYQAAPDVPQAIANKAIDIIERHFAAAGVRRAEELPEENRVHLHRELQSFFQAELPPQILGKQGGFEYDWRSQRGESLLKSVLRWLERVFRASDDEPSA